MKKLLSFALFLLPLLFVGCSDEDDPLEPDLPDNPNPPIENLSSYVPIDWAEAALNSYDPATGDLDITFAGAGAPTFEDGLSLIVVETDTAAYLRRVMESSVNGGSVRLKTIEATMTELFANTEFTLSLTPEMDTKGGVSSDGKIYPSKIIDVYEDGSSVLVYDQSALMLTRAETDSVVSGITYPIFDINMSGLPINLGTSFQNIGLTASWESMRFLMDRRLDIYLKFGDAVYEKEIEPDLKTAVSEIEAFSMRGSMGMDLDIKPKLSASVSIPLAQTPGGDKSSLLRIKRMMMFITPATIPIWIETIIDLRYSASISFSGSASVSAGAKMQGSAGIDISYSKETGWRFGGEIPYEANPYPLEVDYNKNVSTNVTLSLYPHIEYLFYSVLGLYHDIKPYVQNSYAAKPLNFVDATIPMYYLGWQDQLSFGVELQNGISYRFFNASGQLSIPPIKASAKLMEMPTGMFLVSPADGSEVPLNSPTEVKFHVNGNAFLSTAFAAPHVSVHFEPSGTSMVSTNVAVTDEDGNVSVEWTPTSTKDSLVAKIYDGNVELIAQASFKPYVEEEEFSIIGKWWDTAATYRLPIPPYNTVYSKAILEFCEDGTFKYEYNPDLEYSAGELVGDWSVQTGWLIGIEYKTIQGIYKVSSNGIELNPTYVYCSHSGDQYDMAGNLIHAGVQVVITEGVMNLYGSRLNGTVEILDENSFRMNAKSEISVWERIIGNDQPWSRPYSN